MSEPTPARRVLPFVLVLIVGIAVGWMAKGSPRAKEAVGAPAETGDPRWPLGQKLKVGYADPIGDVYRVDEVEIVRIVQEDGSDLIAPDGHADKPRAEWKWYFPGRTYFAIKR